MKFALFILFFGLFTGTNTFASWNKFWPQGASLGAGTFSPYPNQVQVDEQGSAPFLNLHLLFVATLHHPLNESFYLKPQLGITLPESARDGENATSWTFYTNLLLSYKIFEKWELSYGLGWLYNRISGDGGRQVLNNGITTEEFPLPNGPTLSYNFINIVGINYLLNQDWQLGLETFIYNLTSSESRTTAFTFYLQRSFSFNQETIK